MDLFYTELTTKQQLTKLAKNIKKQLNITGSGFKLLHGNIKNFGNCCLFLFPNTPKTTGFKEKNNSFLLDLLVDCNMKNSVISYCYHAKVEVVSKRMITECTHNIETLISIVNPRLIVLLGSESSYIFLARKPKIEDYHGMLVSEHNGVPVLLTYHPEYFTTRSRFEDERYKTSILKSDWKVIKEYYKKRITQ